MQLQPQYDGTYAERLRGRRFWLPLVALALATVLGVYALNRSTTSSAPSGPAPTALSAVAPPLRALLQRLESGQLFCGALHATTPTTATCRFGAMTTATTIRTFASHPATLRVASQLQQQAASAFRRTGAVTFLSIGRDWIVSGIWSSIGNYRAAQTVEALTAQGINQRLHGCLELLPQQSGSCVF